MHKAFVLPQEDPVAYDAMMQTFSVPELVKERIKVSESALARAARAGPSEQVDVPITGATIKAETTAPWLERE